MERRKEKEKEKEIIITFLKIIFWSQIFKSAEYNLRSGSIFVTQGDDDRLQKRT